MLALAGKPMYFLELAVGQFAGVGPLALWNCCPIAQGNVYSLIFKDVLIWTNVSFSCEELYPSNDWRELVIIEIVNPLVLVNLIRPRNT